MVREPEEVEGKPGYDAIFTSSEREREGRLGGSLLGAGNP